MAQIVLGFGTSHAAQLKMPASSWPLLVDKDRRDRRMDYASLLAEARPGLEKEITPEKMQARSDACQSALDKLRELLESVAPDVMVVVGDDQHEQFLDENMPMFCVYRGHALATGGGTSRRTNRAGAVGDERPWLDAQEPVHRTGRQFDAAPDLAEHLIRCLVVADFDVACSNELKPGVGIGHAFGFIYNRLVPSGRIPMLPFMVNTFFAPNQPTPRRCYALGRALREAIESWEADQRVAVIASGGLSHTIIDEELDWRLIDALQEKDAEALCSLPVEKLIRGTSEIRNWMVAAGAMEPMEMSLIDYVPCYRSPAGTGCAMGFASWT